MQNTPTVIYKDNQSTIALVGNMQTSQRTKHIDVRFYYTQDKISNRTIRVEYCPTNEMITNELTKALTPEQFTQLWNGIMMPNDVAGTSGRSVWTTMQRRPTRCPTDDDNRKTAGRTDVNKHNNDGSTSPAATPH
jgi:hypothetical protein